MDRKNICYGCFQEKPEGDVICPHCGFNPGEEQPAPALPVGTSLYGRYTTGKVLGVDGFGITYLGYDMRQEMKVVIKEYMPSGLTTQDSARYSLALDDHDQKVYQNGMDWFLDEAKNRDKRKNMPEEVSVQDSFKENNTAYFVTEYIDGMSQEEDIVSQRERFPINETVTKEEECSPSEEPFTDEFNEAYEASSDFRHPTEEEPVSQTSPIDPTNMTGSTNMTGPTNMTSPTDPTAPAGNTVAAPVYDPGSPAGSQKKSIVPAIVVLLLIVLLIAGGVWVIVTGIGEKMESSVANVAGHFTKQKPAITDVTTQEPEGMAEVELKDYTNDVLSADIGIPEGYEKADDELAYTFQSPDGNALLKLSFNVYDYFPVYTLSDVEEHAEEYVDSYVNRPDNDDVIDHEIISRGYRKIGDLNAYMILYSEKKKSDATELLIAFVECQNGFGCYTLTGSYPQGDKKAQAEMFASINSFQSYGPVDTNWKMFSDETISYHFLYQAAGTEVTCEVRGERQVDVIMNREIGKGFLTITGIPISGQVSKENMLDGMAETTAERPEYEQLNNGERREIERKGIDWIVDRYKHTSEGEVHYMDMLCGEADGYVFMIVRATDSEEALDNEETLMDVTSTIRPVK